MSKRDYAVFMHSGRVRVLLYQDESTLTSELEQVGGDWSCCVPLYTNSNDSSFTFVVLAHNQEAWGYTGTRAECALDYLRKFDMNPPPYQIYAVERVMDSKSAGVVEQSFRSQSTFDLDICNVCGGVRLSAMGSHYGFATNFTSGYESTALPDGLEIALALCEPCALELMRKCVIPVAVREY